MLDYEYGEIYWNVCSKLNWRECQSTSHRNKTNRNSIWTCSSTKSQTLEWIVSFASGIGFDSTESDEKTPFAYVFNCSSFSDNTQYWWECYRILDQNHFAPLSTTNSNNSNQLKCLSLDTYDFHLIVSQWLWFDGLPLSTCHYPLCAVSPFVCLCCYWQRMTLFPFFVYQMKNEHQVTLVRRVLYAIDDEASNLKYFRERTKPEAEVCVQQHIAFVHASVSVLYPTITITMR